MQIPTRNRCRFAIFGALAVAASSCLGAEKPVVEYERHVAPILRKHCGKCHGAAKQESAFRVDQRSALLQGGDLGELAVVPGQPEKSFLLQVVREGGADIVMPPEGPLLTPTELKTLEHWIRQGAKMPQTEESASGADHWAFRPVEAPPVPEAHMMGAANPIDAFVRRRLAEANLQPSPSADRRVLIRRLYLVMHGVPPTPMQIERFVADDRPDAWRRLVDKVLDSPHYGERWARHWLDIIRFGETHGFETNRERPNAWRFRDWVIEAFNRDQPYDDFVREQVAGDALGDPLGTGFLVAGPHDLVKSPDINLTLMQRQDELADLINATGATFLGLTLGCARCHNHKFDPISQKDYYSIQAVFAGVQHGDRPLPPDPKAQLESKRLTKEIHSLRDRLARFIPTINNDFLLVDEAPRSDKLEYPGADHLVKPKGEGVNPSGAKRGHRDEVGSGNRSANVGGGRYVWWSNTPDKDVAAFQPLRRGDYRIWLSWGCGFSTHTQDAKYVLDEDGDLATRGDQRLIATVNQQQFAEAQPKRLHEAIAGKPLWSGFLDAGVHSLQPQSKVLLRGGASGTAITADVIVFESASATADSGSQPATQPRPAFRPPVSAKHNVDRFTPVMAKWIRFTIEATNQSQPCLDELEVFSNEANVALADKGALASSSSNLPGYEIHKLEHVNDGRFGNGRSWISNEPGAGWIQIELPQPTRIERVEWARDREGRFSDRLATSYRIEVATEPNVWQTVASSQDRIPFGANKPSAPAYRFTDVPDKLAKQGRQWQRQLAAAIHRRSSLMTSQAAYAGKFQEPGPTYRLYRGDPLAKREEVSPNTVTMLGELKLSNKAPERDRRVEFANWLTDQSNPLTARVIANRLWQFQFGVGIVDTPSDFGANGTEPTHPQLLDWLAVELIQNGWSLKHLQRQILTSETWRQDSRPRPEAIRIDAATRLLWRFPPRRLEAESIRDSILSVSGLLNTRMGGPGFSGFEVEKENVRHYFPKQTFGPDDWRRMIYMTKVRQEQDAVFGAFDCPDASQVMPKRSRSTTPLQALNLLNSRFLIQQAGLFARRLERSAPESTKEQVRTAYRLCYGRLPADEESKEAVAFVEAEGLASFCRALFNSNEMLFVP